MIAVQIEYMHSGMQFPKYATDGSSGFDLVADNFKLYYNPYDTGNSSALQKPMVLSEEEESRAFMVIAPQGRLLIGCGFKLAIPEGYELQVRGRSGIALTMGLMPANALGTIDSDYRGEIAVMLLNTSAYDVTVRLGERIAQGIIAPVEKAVFERVGRLEPTKRGESGYGSTGKETIKDVIRSLKGGD